MQKENSNFIASQQRMNMLAVRGLEARVLANRGTSVLPYSAVQGEGNCNGPASGKLNVRCLIGCDRAN